MNWVASHRKALVVLGLGILQLCGYVAADPQNLPGWVVSVAVVVNTIGVYLVRNDPPTPRAVRVDHPTIEP